MLLLALDTSTRQASVALCSEQEVYAEYTWHVGNNHSVELLERIQRLTVDSGTALSQVEAVAVATGPGSFNGVRVAVATAKALAFALKKPLIGVSTLDSIAAQQAQGPLCAMLEAGRSELYAACYQYNEEESEHEASVRMQRRSDYLLGTPSHLIATLREHKQDWFGIMDEEPFPPFLFCGEISAASRQAFHEQWPQKSLFLDTVQSTRHASALARLAIQRLEQGQEDDPRVLEPLYLRRPSITTSTRKQPLLGGTPQQPTGPHTTEREEGALRH